MLEHHRLAVARISAAHNDGSAGEPRKGPHKKQYGEQSFKHNYLSDTDISSWYCWFMADESAPPLKVSVRVPPS